MLILGIDPGLCVTGWGVIEDGYRVSNSSTISGVGDVRGVKQLFYLGRGVTKTLVSLSQDELGLG
jgi:Holliday junction resolvasome RuvABC endonuclease subunit